MVELRKPTRGRALASLLVTSLTAILSQGLWSFGRKNVSEKKEIVELTGTCVDIYYFDKRDPTNTWCSIQIEKDRECMTPAELEALTHGFPTRQQCVGYIPRGDLVTGLHYRMMGYYKLDKKYGMQFWPQQWIQSRPLSRHAIVCYLTHYCPGVGETIANRMVDKFGEDQVVYVLKNEPHRVAKEISGISEETAVQIALTLIQIQSTQETMMELRGMLKGRGFPEESYKLIIEKWGASAPDTIKANPFCLMAKHIPGAGWSRCNTMWEEWGLPLDSLTRQMFGVFHIMNSSVDDHTWFLIDDVSEALGGLVATNVKPEAAISEGIKEGWLAEITVDGQRWISTCEKASDEEVIVDFLTSCLCKKEE